MFLLKGYSQMSYLVSVEEKTKNKQKKKLFLIFFVLTVQGENWFPQEISRAIPQQLSPNVSLLID